MKPALEKALNVLADHFMQPIPTRRGEWKCRHCGGETQPYGPVIHTSECVLTVLHKALEAQA